MQKKKLIIADASMPPRIIKIRSEAHAQVIHKNAKTLGAGEQNIHR